MKKALFFDIDGTLWDFQNRIPESTKEALLLLKKNEHLIFLCSGRTRAFIRDPGLLSLGFDGIVSGCGTMIEYRNQVLMCREIAPETAVRTVETIRRFGFRPILEGREFLYMEEEDFRGDRFGDKVRREMGSRLLPIRDYWGKWQISKLSCAMDGADTAGCFAALKEDYDYIVHNLSIVEMVPKGFHKGTGILKVCELLGLSPADTFAFGDSVNDVGMFRAAGTSVAMGNGTDEAKAAAGYVTTALSDDGIFHACRHFELI